MKNPNLTVGGTRQSLHTISDEFPVFFRETIEQLREIEELCKKLDKKNTEKKEQNNQKIKQKIGGI